MPAHLIAEEGPHRGLIFNLEEGDEWVVGRDPEEAVFVLEDSTVSRKHARLVRSPEGIYLENLSRVTPTLVNEEPIQGQLLLNEGDRVQIGQTIFLFSEEPVSERPLEPKENEEIPPAQEELPSSEEESSSFHSYNTIFEDPNRDEILPFHFLYETPLILKVIAGPNAGAEIGLEKGRTYVLGKDPNEADIVFQDLSVSRRHARLHIDHDGTLTIEDLESKNGTVVNGEPITEKKSIATHDMLSLGTTIFLIIDRDAPQETIYSPILPSHETPSQEKDATPSEEEQVVEEEKKGNWKKEPIPTKHLIAAASLVAIFLIVFVSFFSLFKSSHVEIAIKDPTGQLEEALASFNDVRFSFNPATGKLFLVGHVLTAVDAQSLQYQISQLPFISSVEDNVVIDELVNKMMNDILGGTTEFKGVFVQSPKAGQFVVSGFVETNAQNTLLTEYLNTNFPYLDRLENKVAVGENINAQVQGLLMAKGFSSLSFQYTSGTILLSGNYNGQMGDAFNTLIQEIDAIPGVSGIKNYTVPTSANQAAIDISDQFQVTGTINHEGEGYATVLNGKIYTLGELINGMTITDIEPETILLEKEGIKYKINYTR